MKKKDVALLALFIILTFTVSIFAISLTDSQTIDEKEKVAKAYDWLIKQVKGKWQNLNIKQHVFSLLALSCNETYFKPGNASLFSKSFSNQNIRCWGIGPDKPTSPDGCSLTESALGKMVMDEFGYNSTKVKNWLLSRNMTQVDGINWYMQIDVDRDFNASCEIIYGGNEEAMFKISTDKKVSIDGSSKCFYIDVNEPYWFKIKANKDCYSYTYTVKCYSNAMTYRASLLYKKPGTGIWHISSETKSGKPGVPGSLRIEDQPTPLELTISSYCLSNPIGIGNCDYEGTAWSAYVLAKKGEIAEANKFVPYLTVFAEDNIRFFPESFLYPITTQTRYSNNILAAQKIIGIDKGYWLIQPIVYGRVYDTAHAALALETSGGEAITKAKNYLLSNQETSGSLVSVGYGESQKEPIRDTAFALWALWGGYCPGIGGGIGGMCTDMGLEYRCTSNYTCDPDEIEVPELECGFGEICCKFVGAGGGEEECNEAGGYCKESCNASEIDLTDTKLIFCPDLFSCCKAYADADCSEDLRGNVCDTLNGEYCIGEEVESANGTCCLGTCFGGNASEQNCLDIGIPCDTGYICMNKQTWSEIGFTITQDTDRCCVGTNVKCVEDKTCASVGEECSLGEDCIGNIVETKDIKDCCQGQCLEKCSKKQGIYCIDPDEICSGTFVSSSEGSRCCINGKCKKPTGLWWIWIIIIVVILGIGVAYYFFYVKKRKMPPKEKPNPFGGPFGAITRPIVRQTPGAGAAIGAPARRPSSTLRLGPQPRPLSTQQSKIMPMPGLKPTPTPSAPTSAPTQKPKGKTEIELEKTLNKLKKMSKK